MKIKSSKKLSWMQGLLTVCSLLFILSCGYHGVDDLEKFVTIEKEEFVTNAEPVPEIYKSKRHEYSSKNQRDPFKSVTVLHVHDTSVSFKHQSMQFNKQRTKEPLEKFSLSNLRMVGTIRKKSLVWGLIKTPNNAILSVSVGAYMGKNQGLVVAITEQKITLKEEVFDATGRWVRSNKEVFLSR